jgi:hypothetical protein
MSKRSSKSVPGHFRGGNPSSRLWLEAPNQDKDLEEWRLTAAFKNRRSRRIKRNKA